jgi:hypothetical protein
MTHQYNTNSFKFPSQNNTRDISSIIEGSERQFLSYIVDMFNVLNKENIDLKKFGDVIEALIFLKKDQEKDYYHFLVRPEKSKGCKIPSRIPIPSSSFQLKQSINVSTNSLGNVAIAFNPWFLAEASTAVGGTFFINNDSSLTGSASSNFFICRDIGQGIPSVYSSFRLVSSSIVAKYVGRLDSVQGVIGGGIIFDPSVTFSIYGTAHAPLARYGDFNIVQDAFFQQENHLVKGIREIYFPLDSSYESYRSLNIIKTGFNQFIYVSGGPPSANILKVDVFLNFECLPDASFLNYIPTSNPQVYTTNKDDMVKKAQKEAITSESYLQDNNVKNYEKSTFDTVIETLGSVIPSVVDIAKILAMFI